MEPKQTRASAKAKELQTAETPLVRRLKNIKNSKVHEGSWKKIWTEMQEWAYVNKKPTQAIEKIKYSTIFNYVNAPLMASFSGTKEIAVKFIISRYHNGRFHFYQPVDIFGEVISKLTGLSNTGDPVLVGIKEGLVEEPIPGFSNWVGGIVDEWWVVSLGV